VLQIDRSLPECDFALLDLGPGRVDIGGRLLDLCAVVQDRDAGVVEVGLRLVYLCLKDLRIDQRDELPLGDFRIEVRVKRLDIARYLAPTCTETTAFDVPVAEIVASMSPRCTLAIRNSVWRRLLRMAHPLRPAVALTAAMTMSILFLVILRTHLSKCAGSSNGFRPSILLGVLTDRSIAVG
jgi:hypothetical protein